MAQWPHKKVWLAKTGHWAEYDNLTVEQFVQGYIEIVLPTIRHLVRFTYKQILLMIEHKQLKWEEAATRDSIRASQLLSALEEVIQAEFLSLPNTAIAKAGKKQQQQQVKEEAIQTCHSYNTGVCTHTKAHIIYGIKMLHICSHCYTTGKHCHAHRESACHKRTGKA